MLSRKALAIASLCTIVFSAAGMAQETFNGAKFLTYPAESQKSYIGTAVMMAGVIAAKNAPDQARCIDGWAAANISSGYQPVTEAMRKFPDYHPAGVIVAVLQKACGTFEYAKH